MIAPIPIGGVRGGLDRDRRQNVGGGLSAHHQAVAQLPQTLIERPADRGVCGGK